MALSYGIAIGWLASGQEVDTMRPLRAWSRRVLGMFRTTRHERELAAEVESHLQL
jgi:hypothetical protein